MGGRLRVLDDDGASADEARPAPIPPTVEILDGDVLYREWVPGPVTAVGWALSVLLSAVLLATGGALATLGGGSTVLGLALAALGVAGLVTAVCFRGLRIVVDRHGIAWCFGLFRRRYAHGEITMFRERDFAFHRAGVGGWGIGRAVDGVDEYQVWGANGTALDLVVRRNDVTRHYLISTAAPGRLTAALVRAHRG